MNFKNCKTHTHSTTCNLLKIDNFIINYVSYDERVNPHFQVKVNLHVLKIDVCFFFLKKERNSKPLRRRDRKKERQKFK